MGCTTSCIAPSVAELNRSVKAGDERTLLFQLAACPKLLSTPTTVLSSTGITPVHQACESKQIQVVEQILSFVSCSAIETVREALLPYCKRVAKPAPASVADGLRLVVDMENAKGQTPLMYACFADCPELVKLLLSKGADPWIGDRCGRRTALHYAAMGGSSTCIQALMKHIPSRLLTRQGVRYVDARSLCGLTPLHYCIYFGNLEGLRELLHQFDPLLNAVTTSESYDVTVTCEARSAPLHFAAVAGNEEAAREVLRYYAQRVARNQPIPDPRTRVNAAGQLPWQVALLHHPAAVDLASLLHPGQPLERMLFGTSSAHGGPGGARPLGPASLSSIAAASLRAKLLADLQTIKTDGSLTALDPAMQAVGAAAASPLSLPLSRGSGAGANRLRRSNSPASALTLPVRFSELTLATTTAVAHAPAAVAGSAATGMGFPPNVSANGSSSTRNQTDASTVTTVAIAASGGRTTAAASGSGAVPQPCHYEQTGAPEDPICCLPSAAAPPAAAVAVAAAAVCGNSADVINTACEEGSEGLLAGKSQRGDSESGQEEEEEEEGLQCEVCFASRVAVSPAGCRHGLCIGCAEQLCAGVAKRPLNCPFCRRVVSEFVKLGLAVQKP